MRSNPASLSRSRASFILSTKNPTTGAEEKCLLYFQLGPKTSTVSPSPVRRTANSSSACVSSSPKVSRRNFTIPANSLVRTPIQDRPSVFIRTAPLRLERAVSFFDIVSTNANDVFLDFQFTVVVAFAATLGLLVQRIPKSHPLAPADVHLLCRDSVFHQLQRALSGEVAVLVVAVSHYLLVCWQI